MLKAVALHWDVLGALLATLDDSEQAAFFTAFAKELDGYPTHFQREVQMLNCGHKIPEKSKETLERYMPCLWYKSEKN